MSEPTGQILSAEFKQQIADALGQRRVGFACPACAGQEIALVDGYLAQPIMRLHEDGTHFEPERQHVLIAIECTHCGYLRHHNLARLGLAPEGANWSWENVWSDQAIQAGAKATAAPDSTA